MRWNHYPPPISSHLGARFGKIWANDPKCCFLILILIRLSKIKLIKITIRIRAGGGPDPPSCFAVRSFV